MGGRMQCYNEMNLDYFYERNQGDGALIGVWSLRRVKIFKSCIFAVASGRQSSVFKWREQDN
jgi:hypothetical protein